jgi:hypothetical protein
MSSTDVPDPTSPGAVAGASFPVARKGFEPTAVRDFLRRVSQELGRAQHDRDRLVRELEQAREAGRHQAIEDLDQATVAAKLGEEAARVLATAHEAATQIRTRLEDTGALAAELDGRRQRLGVAAAARRRQGRGQTERDRVGQARGREMVAEARAIRGASSAT